jgi:Ni/Co efflux regulator RcnB
MTQINKTPIATILVLTAIAILNANQAIADKPSKTGGGKHEKHQQNGPQGKQEKHTQNKQQGNYQKQSHQDNNKSDFYGGGYFNDQHRTVINNYYDNEYRTGRCPPGLSKKQNGCMPPGQAKKWAKGQPLPRDVVFYDLPPAVMANIGQPPAGYRLVRVDSDILMINTVTGIVMDALSNWGR